MKFFVVFVMAALFSLGAAAEPYPSKPIQLIVAFGAGGSTDVMARAIAKSMTETLGQSVVVVNMPGAGGSIGMTALAKARPDGYTIGIGNVSGLSTAGVCLKNISYDPMTDFIPVSRFAELPNLLAVPKASPFRDFSALLAALKQSPSRYNYGAQFCTNNHLIMELINHHAGVKTNLVPYKTAASLVIEAVRGDVDIVMDNIVALGPHIANGSLRPLAVTGTKRVADIPDVPTYHELGLPEADIPAWYGILTPANTPQPVIERLRSAMRLAVKDPEFLNTIKINGAQPLPITGSAEFSRVIAQEIKRIKVVSSNVKLN